MSEATEVTGEAASAGGDGPRRDTLVAAVEAFKAGDFATTRRRLRELRGYELPASLQVQVDELWRRTSSDPVAIWSAIGCVALFLVVVYLSWFR